MNCTIEQEFVLNVWLNLYDEGAYAMCHQCHDSIYTGYHFIFQLHKVNNLRIPGVYGCTVMPKTDAAEQPQVPGLAE